MRYDGEVIVGIKADTKSFDNQIKEAEWKLRDLVIEYETMSEQKGFNEQSKDAKLLRLEIEKVNNKLIDLKKKQLGVDTLDFSQFGKGLKGTIKNIKKWALALVGIRSAYMGIRTITNEVSQHNKDVANVLSYTKSVLATAFEPVIITIVEWLKTALSYVNLLFKTWFKRDLFAETNKNLKKANKSARELKKTLTGFDELNILNSSSTGGGGGVSSSDIGLPDAEATGIFGWILNNKDEFLEILASITAGLVAMKVTGLGPIIGVLTAILTSGIYTFISSILEMIENPSWQSFGGILEGLGLIIASISGILMVLGVASGPIGWIMVAVGILIGTIGALTIELSKNRDGIKDVEQANKDLNDAQLALANADLAYIRAVKDKTKAEDNLKKSQKGVKESAEELYKMVKEGKITYENLTDKQKNVYEAYLSLLEAQARETAASEKSKQARKEETKAVLEQELANAKAEDSYDSLKEKVLKAYNEEMITAGEASDYISRAMAQMDFDTMKAFSEDIPASIISGLDPYKYKTTMEKLKAWWNGEIAKFDKEIKLKVSVQAQQIMVDTAILGHKSVNFGKGGIYYPKLTPLAVGGLINQPGRGVPYHGAKIGERGTEGILPLTDSQQMSILGEAIGKNVNIVATVPVYVGNRMVTKEMKRINAEDDFAFNR